MSKTDVQDKRASNKTVYVDNGHIDHPDIHGKGVKAAHQQHHPRLQPKLITLVKHPHVKVKRDGHLKHAFRMDAEHYVMTVGSLLMVLLFIIAIIRWKTRRGWTKGRKKSSELHIHRFLRHRTAPSPSEMHFLEDVVTLSMDGTQSVDPILPCVPPDQSSNDASPTISSDMLSSSRYVSVIGSSNTSLSSLSVSSCHMDIPRNESALISHELSGRVREDSEQTMEPLASCNINVETRNQTDYGVTSNIPENGPRTPDIDATDVSEILSVESSVTENQSFESNHLSAWRSFSIFGQYFNAFKDLWFKRIGIWNDYPEAVSLNQHCSDDNSNEGNDMACTEEATVSMCADDTEGSVNSMLNVAEYSNHDRLSENSYQNIPTVCTDSTLTDAQNEAGYVCITTSQVNNVSELISSECTSTNVQRNSGTVTNANPSLQQSTLVDNNNNISSSAFNATSHRRSSVINICPTSSHHTLVRNLTENGGVSCVRGQPSASRNFNEVQNVFNHRRRMRRRNRSQSHYSRIPSTEVSRTSSQFHADGICRCPIYYTAPNSIQLTGDTSRVLSRFHTTAENGVVMEQMPDGSRLVLIPPPRLPEYSEATPPPPYQ